MNQNIEQQCESTNVSSDYSQVLSYESTKNEYDHCVQRSEKLDNKVYIILTVYAFLFVLLCDNIKKIDTFSFPENQIQLALVITYSIFLMFNIILYIFTLIKLVDLLKAISIERFDPQTILENNMISTNSKALAKYICSLYTKCIYINNSILEKRFQKFNVCIKQMFPIILTSLFLNFISSFIERK